LLIFILFSLAFIAGMAFAVLTGAAASGLFLLLTAVFFTCGVIPFWFRHGANVMSGNFDLIRNDEEPVPVLTIFFLMLSFACVGSFWYISELDSNYSGHLKKICDKYDDSTTWNVRGTILEEPKLKGDHLELIIKPEIIRRVERKRMRVTGKSQSSGGSSGSKRRSGYETVVNLTEPEVVKGGLILAQVFEDTEVFRQVDFNQNVEIEGQLFEPSEKRNPGSLDYRRYLRNRGVYRTVRIVPRKADLRIISETEDGSIWYRFALHIKDEVLKVIKQTMPYPESSFLGGVLLGLKGGLPKKVTQEFRMTGVSHVLAVSGLHVTIIAGLLYGIFSVFKIPLKVFAPIIVFSLFTFALIVGWPSSAVRAALMNSLFILSRAYLKERGFKLSVVFSLCVAADFILINNPLQLTEPSFVLSVMAIYALAMFSEPAGEMLRKILRGPGLFFAFLATMGFFLAVIIKKDLVLMPWFFPATFFYIIASALISAKLADSSSYQSFAFEMLPNWLQGFLGAQIAIFVAMMGPLSAFYFGQLSLAAPVANIIAIPLIGLIVQIGLIAGLCGAFIPVIGIYLALILNAANWLAVKFFLAMATFFSLLIPFPRVSQPGFAELAVYYVLLHLFFFRKEIAVWGKAISHAVLDIWEDPDYRTSLKMVSVLILIVVTASGVLALTSIETRPDFRATMLDVGYGSSVLIEDGGKVILVDAGLNDTLAEIDRGERVVQPALSEKKIAQIDAVILSSMLPERISGLSSVMRSYKVNKVYAPFPIPQDRRRISFEDFARSFSLADIKMQRKLKKGLNAGLPSDFYWEIAYESYNRLIEDLAQFDVPFEQIKAGDSIKEGNEPIEVLFPDKISDRYAAYYDGLILKISSKGRNILFCSGNVHPLENLVNFSPDYIFLADLPYPYNKFERFVKSRNPEGIAVSFRFPASWLVDGYHLAGTISARNKSYIPRFREWRTPVYITSANGAIEVSRKRSTFSFKPYLKE
jgi:ComEC/Rec2-related protein